MAGAAVAAYLALRSTPPPKLTLKPARFDQLAGWGDDDPAAALPALRKSCAVVTARPDDARFDPALKAGDFGTVGEWRALCAQAAALPAGSAVVRRFFEDNFTPLLAGDNGRVDGLFTGYYEIVLDGSRVRGGPFQIPIYRRPPDPKAYSHAAIDGGALAGKGLELVWVADPIDAYFLQIQGSGEVRLAEGGRMRLGYDGGNGQRYVAIGRLLVERGEVPLKEMTMARLREWLAAHGEAGAALMRENPSYVFFKEIAGDGPIGSEKTVLTAGRSLAIDRRFLPMGLPIWLDARQRFVDGTIRRLVVAQDTGGAIKGPVRGDLYIGGGDAAGREAGALNAAGRYYLLLPNTVAARALAAAHD
ncbi:MAG TPA: MltA domain-containing protein [Stellaceae bacterium]|nr:MltA domain-containing protein [Stellaceae bacterium]